MKIFLLIVLQLCFWCVMAAAQEAGSGLVDVGGTYYMGKPVRNYLRLSQVVSSPAWDPISQPLPVDLGTAFVRARDRMVTTEHLTESQTFSPWIQISRLSWDDRNTNVLEAPILTDKWAIEFEFHWMTNQLHSTSIVLFDGTYASPVDLAQLQTPEMTNELRTSISRFSPVRLESLYMDTDALKIHHRNVQKVINKPDFQIPNIQRNPDNGAAFPLDLQAGAMRGRDIAARNNSMTKESLSLEKISLERYVPFKASQFLQLGDAERTNNWFADYEYGIKTNQYEHYWVCELLDGRIVVE
jgi:hypothetical protein